MPAIIIGVVLISMIGGGYYLYQSSRGAGSSNSQRNQSNGAVRTPMPPVTSSSVGAQPPHMLGSPSATVTVEEFADFQCPSCAQVHPTVKQLQSIYGPKIRFIFREFPLAMHDKAYDAALAAEAAGLQGKFWAMQDLLFQNQAAWSSAANAQQVFNDFAQRIGLDVQRFETDMGGMATRSRVDQDVQRGRGMGIDSTPTIFINNRPVPYQSLELNAMRQLIDAELQKSAGATSTSSSAPTSNSNTAGN